MSDDTVVHQPLADVPPVVGVAKPGAILMADGVRRTFGGLRAVDVEHLEVPRGVITALIGPNGAGKTTFFNLVTRFDRLDAGRIEFDGRRIDRLRAHAVARAGMVRTFQLTKTLSRVTVRDNLRLAAPGQPGEKLWAALLPPVWRARERAIDELAEQAAERFQLTRVLDDYAGTLSGGQRKLLDVARALMAEPNLVMLDEPMAGVNPTLRQELVGHMADLRAEGRTIFFIEHDMDVVMGVSDWVVCMAEGRIIAEGPPRVVAGNERVIQAYLGERHVQVDPMSDEQPLIEVRDLVAGYVQGLDILHGCSVELRAGEIVGIIGPNGAGKSTLLKVIFGLVPVRSGSVELRGADIAGRAPHELVAQGVGYVPQVGNVFASLTVDENLRTGLYQRPKQLAQRLAAVREVFPLLHDRRGQRAGALSGGERQMVAMARALMMEPSVLLLDEPSAGLSPMVQEEAFARIEHINETGVAVMLVEQNAHQCLNVSHRAYVLDQGRDAHTGTGRELLHDPRVVQLYLGTLAKYE